MTGILRAAVVVALLGVGSFFLAVGTVGLLRLPDVYNRLHATSKATTLGAASVFLAGFVLLSGALQGASETRTPFVARVSGLLVVYLGVSVVGGYVLGYGPLAVYVAVAAWNVWGFAIVCWGFARGDWAERAAAMMADRGSAADESVVPDATRGADAGDGDADADTT